jgi:hypothetical protein
MQVDTSNWSGEGAFTHFLVERLQRIEGVVLVRVEDAPASRSEADYNFISNEIFVGFAQTLRRERFRRFWLLPASRAVVDKAMTVSQLEGLLAAIPEIGGPDYADEGMLQYLRTQRVVPPYQTRGYKLVELVRLYEVGSASRA